MPVKKKKTGSKKVEKKSKTASRGSAKTKAMEKITKKSKAVTSKSGAKTKPQKEEVAKVVNRISPPRIQSGDEKKSRGGRVVHQYNYMKAPGILHDFKVGDKVEVYCDHEKGRERVRGWIGGIVVQVDNKMVAVQFRSNVYLTDGWMVPDRILWYPLTSEHIRSAQGKRSTKKEKVKIIPDY